MGRQRWINRETLRRRVAQPDRAEVVEQAGDVGEPVDPTVGGRENVVGSPPGLHLVDRRLQVAFQVGASFRQVVGHGAQRLGCEV